MIHILTQHEMLLLVWRGRRCISNWCEFLLQHLNSNPEMMAVVVKNYDWLYGVSWWYDNGANATFFSQILWTVRFPSSLHLWGFGFLLVVFPFLGELCYQWPKKNYGFATKTISQVVCLNWFLTNSMV